MGGRRGKEDAVRALRPSRLTHYSPMLLATKKAFHITTTAGSSDISTQLTDTLALSSELESWKVD